MDPLALTLLGYPLSILANITLDQIRNINNKINDFTLIENLYIKCLYNAIDNHNKHFDNYFSNILVDLKKAIKKDEAKFLLLISENGNIFLTSFNRKEFHEIVAQKIVETYDLNSVNSPKLISEIITDCFSYYIDSFYNLMNEKEGIQAILTECLKLDNILDLLNKINQQIVTKDEFDNLRKVFFNYYTDNNQRYKKNVNDYDSYVSNKFKFLELSGFSPKISGKEVQMELDDIFVPLAINRYQRIVPNILEIRFENDNASTFKSIEILEHRAIVILGDPGSGKSTLLKYLLTQIVALRKSEHVLKNIIPVLFKLSDYSEFYKRHRKSIFEFITNHLDDQYQHIYKENLEYSNMLILMDGLDEIAETPLRLKVTEQVMDLFARYPNNRYIITSRIVGYQESRLGGDFIQYKLLPFRKEEIEIFSNQWYKSIASHTDNNYEQAKQQASNLYNSIFRNPSVLKLATNPLLMTIIAMIHYQGKRLPSKRIELYEISTETFLEHWVQLRITDEKQLKDKSEIIEILAPIAFEIHNTKSNALIEEKEFKTEFLKNFQGIHTNTPITEAKLACNEFIQFLRQYAGFFYEKGVDDEGYRYYGFMHLTFEEYLASIEFVSRWSENAIKIEDYIFQSRWSEIIRLAASQIRLSFKGKAGRTKTSSFVNDLLNVNDDFKDAYRPLQLACLIISDDVSINDELQNEIFDKIINILSSNVYNSLLTSMCEIFSELFQSEKQNYFIERIRNTIKSDNEVLIRNLVTILIENFDFPSVKSIFKENISNPVILDEILNVDFEHPIREDAFIMENILRFLTEETIEINNADYFKIAINVLSVIGINKYLRSSEQLDKKRILEFLTEIEGCHSNDLILIIIIDYLLVNIEKDRIAINIIEEITIHINNIYTRNLRQSIKKINLEILEDVSDFKQSVIKLSKKMGVIYQNNESLIFFNWNNNFSKLTIESMNTYEVDTYLDSIKNRYNFEDYELIKNQFYFIIGPYDSGDNLTNFINSFKLDDSLQYTYLEWKDFPFLEISKKPKIISEILIKNSWQFLSTNDEKGFKDLMNVNVFNDLGIPAPVKLLVSIKTSRPYNPDLINETISYYNKCDNQLKKGVFEILYSVLNLTNTTDNREDLPAS